jgi:hypothetical protein
MAFTRAVGLDGLAGASTSRLYGACLASKTHAHGSIRLKELFNDPTDPE